MIDIKIIQSCWLTLSYIVSVWHSMSVEAWTALVHMYCTVVHGCHVSSMQENLSHIFHFMVSEVACFQKNKQEMYKELFK